MAARPRTTAAGPAAGEPPADVGVDLRRLAPALAAAAVAAVALAAGAALGVVDGGRPGVLPWPLLMVLAALPVALAGVLAIRGRPSTAAGVLAGAAALAPGRAVVDLQLAVDASLATRPELTVPGPIDAPPSWLGLGLLLLGHAALVLAGVLAVQVSSALPDDVDPPDGLRQAVPVAAGAAVLVLAVGLLLPPYVSADANLLDRSALDGPLLVALGVLATGLAAVLAVALAMVARSWGLATGVLAGVAVASSAVVVPPLLGALTAPWLHLAAGPLVVLAGAAALLVIPRVAKPMRPSSNVVERTTHWESTRARVTRAAAAPATAARAAAAQPGSKPRQYGLYLAAGVLAVVAAGCAFAGARAPLVLATTGQALARTDAQVWLIPAGAVVGVLGVALLVPKFALAVRPAAAVAWVAVVLAGSAVLERAVNAAELPVGIQPGSGTLYTALGIVAAVLLGGCAVVAGMVEREDAEPDRVGPPLMWPAVAAAVMAVGAFVAPVVESPEYEGAGLAQGVGLSFWGMLAALLVVLGGLALAPRSRPARAVALLAGLLCVVGVRLLELVAVGGTAQVGVWFATGCLAVLLVMLALAARAARRTPAR